MPQKIILVKSLFMLGFAVVELFFHFHLCNVKGVTRTNKSDSTDNTLDLFHFVTYVIKSKYCLKTKDVFT